MSPFAIAWRNLRTRPLQTVLTALIIALGVGLALAIVVLSAGLRRGLTTAGGPFELVVGPKGSATQLVVSSVLLQDVPIGNMPYAQYQALQQDERVRDAVPIALGDNVAGLRLVGTSVDLFDIRLTPERPPFYQLAAGQPFNAEFEAVLGSAAASRLGLTVGGTFVSSHGALGGLNQDDHSNAPYRVVGVLAPTGTPADSGIYVSLDSYWDVHGLTHGDIVTPGATVEGTTQGNVPPTNGVTAVLVRARDISAAYQLYQQLNAGSEVQAALPGAVLTQFLDLLGQGTQVLTLITYVALAMAALSVALSLYGAVQARQREIAVLRALGASRATVLTVALWEAALQGTLGLALGTLFGHAAAFIAALLITGRSALAVPLRVESAEIAIVLAMLALGLVAGLWPALRAYRVEAARVLAGT